MFGSALQMISKISNQPQSKGVVTQLDFDYGLGLGETIIQRNIQIFH